MNTTKSIYPLHAATPGAIVIIDEKKWVVTDIIEALNLGNRKLQYVYCYPYSPKSKKSKSIVGENFPAHIIVKHYESH